MTTGKNHRVTTKTISFTYDAELKKKKMIELSSTSDIHSFRAVVILLKVCELLLKHKLNLYCSLACMSFVWI